VAGLAFVWHERRSAAPMLDLDLFSNGTVRGASIAQIGTSIAMASVMFGLILHFQYAYGWSPMKAGLVTTQLPAGTWGADLVASFFHGEQITYALLAVVVGLVAGGGALALTDSRTTEEHPDETDAPVG
jgi:hypothetical protein